MIAAIIIMASLVAFAQFAVYRWRATITGIAAQSISERVCLAAGITGPVVGPQDFHNIIILKDLSPGLQSPNASFATVQAYYAMMEKLASVVPGMAGWANAEMAICARYAAVVMDQHLECNLVCAAQIRGM